MKISQSIGDDKVKNLIEGMHSLLIRNTMTKEYVEQIKFALSGINTTVKLPQIKDSIELLKKTLTCSCGAIEPSIHLNCNHFLCDSCFSESINLIKPKLKFPYDYYCPICSLQHPTSSMEIITKDWKNIIEESKATNVQSDLAYNCSTCTKRSKPKTNAAPYIACEHKCCKECLAAKYRQGDYYCDRCNLKFTGNPCDEKGYCNGCSEIVFYVGDYLTSVNCGHMHCYDCVCLAYHKKACEDCSRLLDEQDLWKLYNRIYGSCQVCYSYYERAFLVNKQCCPQSVCAPCQLENPLNCRMCNSELNSYAVQLIQDFDYAINE
jgi:hypothetical protein